MKTRIESKTKKISSEISTNKIKIKQTTHKRKRTAQTLLMEWLDRGPQVNLQNNAQHWEGHQTEINVTLSKQGLSEAQSLWQIVKPGASSSLRHSQEQW